MNLKKQRIWIATLLLVLCIAEAQAETIVIEDCGECAGHVILGMDKLTDCGYGSDIDLDKVFGGSYDHKEIILGNKAVSVVSGSHDITLDQVIIDVFDQEDTAAFFVAPGAEVHLTLENESILVSSDGCAGIQVPQGAKLKIMEESTGHITAWGGMNGAGIGGGMGQSSGEIGIFGGTVIAKTRRDDKYIPQCAGIGGGMYGGYERIVVSGGMVYAEGYNIGIGGECSETGGNIEISGGIVYAIGDEMGAAIGGVSENLNTEITITGGTVYASGGYDEGIAIGCNYGTIRFDGGIVYVIGQILSDDENGRLIVADGLVSANGLLLTQSVEN